MLSLFKNWTILFLQTYIKNRTERKVEYFILIGHIFFYTSHYVNIAPLRPQSARVKVACEAYLSYLFEQWNWFLQILKDVFHLHIDVCHFLKDVKFPRERSRFNLRWGLNIGSNTATKRGQKFQNMFLKKEQNSQDKRTHVFNGVNKVRTILFFFYYINAHICQKWTAWTLIKKVSCIFHKKVKLTVDQMSN